MELIFSIFFFLLGAAFASFINVIVLGGKSVEQNLKRKRSRCKSCKKTLVWWELIPVFSWIYLNGRCSKCKKPIPFYHVFTELVLGLMFWGVYQSFGSSPFVIITYLLFVVVTYFFSIHDIEKGTVPNKWILPVIGISFVLMVIVGIVSKDFTTFVGSRILAAVGYSVFFVLMNVWSMSGFMPGVSKGKQGFGWGDAKYAPFIGIVLGPVRTILSGWIGVFSGAVVGVILMIKCKEKNMRIPYIPFMSIGAWCALLWGEELIDIIRDCYII